MFKNKEVRKIDYEGTVNSRGPSTDEKIVKEQPKSFKSIQKNWFRTRSRATTMNFFVLGIHSDTYKISSEYKARSLLGS